MDEGVNAEIEFLDLFSCPGFGSQESRPEGAGEGSMQIESTSLRPVAPNESEVEMEISTSLNEHEDVPFNLKDPN